MAQTWNYLVANEELEDLFRLYCTDHTALAKLGRSDPITGRDKEIDEVVLILLQKGRKNSVLLAPAGVGKTALVTGLAQKIIAGEVPDYLADARILEIDMARMAAGTSSPAEFQERFIPLCKGIAERYHNPDLPRMILFIDEIHQIMPGCEGSAYAGLSNVMKPYLTAGDLMVIGATTLDEFRMHVEQDPALERRFQKVFLEAPNVSETYDILKSIRSGFVEHHKTEVSDADLMVIVHLTEEHMRKRNQPDKSIITLDSAMAYHQKMHGTGGKLDLESIYYMVSRETGLNRQALHDERKVQKIIQQVAEIEGERDTTHV